MTKLTQEDKEIIDGMALSDEWKSVMKFVDRMVENMKVNVHTCNIDNGSREIVLRKAKLDGALMIKRAMENIRQEIKSV